MERREKVDTDPMLATVFVSISYCLCIDGGRGRTGLVLVESSVGVSLAREGLFVAVVGRGGRGGAGGERGRVRHFLFLDRIILNTEYRRV